MKIKLNCLFCLYLYYFVVFFSGREKWDKPFRIAVLLALNRKGSKSLSEPLRISFFSKLLAIHYVALGAIDQGIQIGGHTNFQEDYVDQYTFSPTSKKLKQTREVLHSASH